MNELTGWANESSESNELDLNESNSRTPSSLIEQPEYVSLANRANFNSNE